MYQYYSSNNNKRTKFLVWIFALETQESRGTLIYEYISKLILNQAKPAKKYRTLFCMIVNKVSTSNWHYNWSYHLVQKLSMNSLSTTLSTHVIYALQQMHQSKVTNVKQMRDKGRFSPNATQETKQNKIDEVRQYNKN